MRWITLCVVLISVSAQAETLEQEFDRLRQEAELPAVATLRIADGQHSDHYALGHRAANQPQLVGLDDRWHLGSCTKAMTATLIATLVADGQLDWDATIPQALAGLDIDPAYADVTIAELLRMRAGTPANGPILIFTMAERGGALDASEARRRYVAELLSTPPDKWNDASSGRGQHHYSNAAYVIAGHCAEVITGRSWEDLMRSRLFEPLHMNHADFGPPPATQPDQPTPLQPLGHLPKGSPVPPGPYADNPQLLGPAGTVHTSIAGWAAFIQCHLDGPSRPPGQRDALGLTAEHYRTLHDPGPLDVGSGDDPVGYAMGWLVLRRHWAGPDGGPGLALSHGGSNTLWYAVTWLAPQRRLAALAATNTGRPTAPGTLDLIAYRLLTRPD
ncbi:MAG: serine hydrolase domain-containing protein [Planctomycetota bacterium]